MKVTVSTKGQLVIPKAVRERHQLVPGSEVEVEDRGDVIVLRPTESARRFTVDDLLALPRVYDGPAVSVEEMDAARDAAVGDGWRRG